MKKTLSLGFAWLLLALAAGAAEIHGTVSEDGKTLPQGVALKLDCGGTTASGQTDQYGSYSLKVGATGECTVSVDYKGSSASVKVVVYDKPSKYDLVVKQEGGKLVLMRK